MRMATFIILFLLFCITSAAYTIYNVTCNLGSAIINTTSDMFISFNLDYYQIYNGINIESSRLEYLTKQLSPAIVRVGGTDGDFVYFDIGDEKGCNNLPKPGYDDGEYWNYTCLSMDKFDTFISWSKKTNTKIVWSLPVGYPLYPNVSSLSWNSTNSKQFLQYLKSQNYTSKDIYGFGIGNEINYGDPFINATWQANAFKQLNNILTEIYGTSNHGFKLIGPDPHSSTVRPQTLTNSSMFRYIEDFFQQTCDFLYAGDYHVYINLVNSSDYITPNGLNLQNYESGRIMNDINYDTECMKKVLNNIHIGEIGPMNHEIEWKYQDMINKYWDGFWWLDSIGFASKIGQKVAQRWRLYSQNNTVKYNKNLIGDGYIPNPDYYTSYLFKYIMGINVLDIESNNEYLRVYSHCTEPKINGMIYGRDGIDTYTNNNYNYNYVNLTLINPVSISWISLFNQNNNDNINSDNVNIYINQLNQLIQGDVIQFTLTPGNKSAGSNGLESTTIALNGNVLQLDNNGMLPDLTGNKINLTTAGDCIKVPQMSYGFVVFTQTSIGVCAVQ